MQIIGLSKVGFTISVVFTLGGCVVLPAAQPEVSAEPTASQIMMQEIRDKRDAKKSKPSGGGGGGGGWTG